MKYKLKVKDTAKWINSIVEISNNSKFLWLEVDFAPKYLQVMNGSSSTREILVSVFKTEETLRAGDGECEISILPEWKFSKVVTDSSRYGLSIFVFCEDNLEECEIVY